MTATATITATPTVTNTPTATPTSTPTGVVVARIIDYTYDPLYRLTNATYNDGTFFTYTYDPVGNRLTEVTNSGTTTYVYDIANRLTSVGGVTQTWDNNGNLLSDGTSTYTYDRANRLKTVVQGGTTYAFTYNGMGDRLRQTINSVPTTYALDVEGGLTQVLTDGSNFYLYGAGRIAEKQTVGWRYHVPDALGSVRQLLDSAGAVTLARAYAPFGNTLYTDGAGATAYGYTGEQRDGTGLTFLRARYYASLSGRFVTRDIWDSRPEAPMSLNYWLYARQNPILYVDPSGMTPQNCANLAPVDREECLNLAPDTYVYNEKNPPRNITWFPSTTIPSALGIPQGENAAQYRYRSGWNGLCGQLSLAAILGRPVKDVIQDWIGLNPQDKQDPSYTSATQLVRFVNEVHGKDWYAWDTRWRGQSAVGLASQLKAWLLQSSLVLPLVEIVSASSGDQSGGRVGATGRAGGCTGEKGAAICHWVVITALSAQWKSASDNSEWNWIRVFNPFDNETEYYWWSDFRRAWLATTGNYRMVVMRKHTAQPSGE